VFAHESRTDFAMILSAICLGVAGAGPWAVDAWLLDRLAARKSPQLAV
jgi:hypothetical protein